MNSSAPKGPATDREPSTPVSEPPMEPSPAPSPDASTADSGVAGAGASHHAEHRQLMPLWLALVLIFLGGVGIAGQTRINGALGADVGSGLFAALLSNTAGGVVITAITLATVRGRTLTARYFADVFSGRFPWYLTLGGMAGAYYVLTQGIAAGVLGASLFVVAIIAGQALGGAVTDRLGVGPGGPRKLHANRIVGTLLTLGAVAFGVFGNVQASSVIWMAVLPFTAGLLMAGQQGTNGRVKVHTGSTRVTTLANFIIGTALLIVMVPVFMLTGSFNVAPLDNWWLLLGGLFGVIFIGVSAATVETTGVLLLGVTSIAGQIVGALTIDWLAPAPGTQITSVEVITAAITVVAAIVASIRLPGRRSKHVSSNAQ